MGTSAEIPVGAVGALQDRFHWSWGIGGSTGIRSSISVEVLLVVRKFPRGHK
jgi:hypothetical protein